MKQQNNNQVIEQFGEPKLKTYIDGFFLMGFADQNGKIVIPAQWHVNPVNFSEGLISIGDAAFNNCTSLKEIKLPDSVETIGTSAFLACDKLVSINIPKNLKKTNLNKIFDSNVVTTVTVADGNKTYDSRDNCNAVIETATNKLVFATANSTIPEGVITIDDKAFKNLEDLEEITNADGRTVLPAAFAWPSGSGGVDEALVRT